MIEGQVDPRYGDASKPAPEWSDIDQRLAEAQLYWLVTVRRDGRPHAVPLCGVWRDGAFSFCTGAEEQKMRNLDANPRVAVTAGPLGANGWDTGKDIVVEGSAVRVTDAAQLRSLAEDWATKYDGEWQFDVRDGQFVQRTEGEGDAHGGAQVFRVEPDKVIVFGDDHGQTTYRPA